MMSNKDNNPLLPKQEDATEPKSLQDKVVEVLEDTYDPEIPVSIWELGLVYDINVSESREVTIRMTLTSPACPIAGLLVSQVERRLKQIPEVKDATVELVWDPPWNKEMMSEAAKLQLGFL